MTIQVGARKWFLRRRLVLGWRELQILGFAPNEQRKSVVPHLRRSTARLWTQPFRAGLFLVPALWAWIANTAYPCSFLP